MADFQIKTPTIRVPGLLSDDALQEQLKQFKASGLNGGASQAPSSAVEMADRVQSEFFDSPVRSAIKAAAPLAGPLSPVISTAARLAPDLTAPAPVDPQQRAIDVRSNILSNEAMSGVSSFYLGGGAGVLAREGGLLDAAGTLTPAESEQEKAERDQEARDAEATVKRHVDVREQLRALTDDQASAMGLPVAPGTDAQTNKEVREMEQARGVDRVARAEKDTATAEAAPAPTKAWWLDAIRSFSRAQTEGYTSIAKGAVIALRELPFTAFGAATGGETERSDMRAWFDTVDATMLKLLPPDKARDQDFMRTLTAGAGSMTSFLTASTVAGALGLPSKVATMITGAATGATTQYEDAEKHDGTELQKLISFFAGSALGSSEALPINRMLGRAERATGGLVTRMLRQSAAGSLEEFVQELGQNVGQDLVAKWTYDEQREMDPQTYLKAAGAGAILGAMGGTAATVMERNGILPKGEDAPADDGQAAQAAIQLEAQQQEQLEQMILTSQVAFDELTDVPADLQAQVAPPLDVTATGTTEAEAPAASGAIDVATALIERHLKEQRPAIKLADEFAAALTRPPLFEDAKATAKGGTVPGPNASGTITLRHFSAAPLAEIDPAQQGTGPLIGQERARLFGPDAVPRSYYGVRSGPEYVPPKLNGKEYAALNAEERKAAKKLEKANVSGAMIRQAMEARYRQETRQAGYQQEGGLGDYMHEVEVQPDELYNVAEDPLGIRETLTATDQTSRITEYERKVKEAGFRGAYFPDSQLGQTAILFDKAQPARVIDQRYGLPVEEIAQPTDFEAPTPESFSKGGWAVLTATQEALGDFSSPENVAADEKLRKTMERQGLKFVPVEGAYQGVKQGPTYMVFAPDAATRKLGQQFKQESVLTRDGLVYTDGSNKLVPGRGVTVGPEAEAQDFYSKMPDGTAWTMDLDFETEATQDEFLASTNATRGSYKGEPKRRSQTVGQTDPASDNVSLRQIANNFTKLLGLTVRQGRFTLKGKDIMGQFSTRTGVVRMRTPSDISTLIHEGGHALENGADGELRNFITAHKTELDAAARSLYAGDLAKLPPNAVTSEGFAEFFRVFVTNRRYADANFPTLSTDFATLLDQHNPQLRDGLRLIGDQYAAWLQLPSAQLIRNMIQTGKETTGINGALAEAREQGMVNWFREWVNGVFTSAINQNNNLNMLVADVLNTAEARTNMAIDLKRADDPRVLIRLAANSGNRAMVQLTDGVMPHRSTTPASAGLRDVLLRYHGLDNDKQLRAIDEERQADFAAYVVSLRGIDEYRRWSLGIIDRAPMAATLGDLTTTVTEMETKYGQDFAQAAQMLHDYSMALWEKSYQAGLIDDKTYQDGNTRQFYVPLQRDMSDKDSTQSGIAASAVARGGSIVKRFRGSDRDIIDPMDALMQKTFALEKVIAENEVKVALAKLADKAGTVGSLVERIPASKLLGQQYGVEEVARQLAKDPSLSPADAADLMTLLDAAIDDGNRIALFRSQQVAAAGENVVFFWEKGKLAALQIKDGDIGADIINTLNAVGTETVPLLTELIAYPSTVFRAAVTSWPDFLLVNFIRDQMSAFVLTEGYTPFVTGIRGVSDEIRQHTWAREYNAAMGTMGGMNSSTLHDARVKKDIASLQKKGYLARVWRDKSATGIVKGFARITELTETGTRLGIYRSAYERGMADGLTPWEASVEASYLSTDYIDFGLHGNRMLAWRRMIPFLNAQLQGLNKMVRTLAGDEVRQRKGLMFAVSAFFKDTRGLNLSRAEQQAVRTGRKAWLKMASLGIIGAAINAIFQDDPDYQDASEYLRTTGWVIPVGDGQIFYIPKPFELAMVSNIVERGLEAASGDKEAKNRLLRGMAMNLLPPTNPPAIQALVEQLANWQSFSGQEIVPDYMRALEPELQYNHYTSEFAKGLGQMLGWSPMRIDHAFSALGASAYRDLNALYNASDESRPQSDITDWPMTRRFVRDARRGSVSAQDFWKFASTVSGSLRRAEVSYKNYIEAGQERTAENYLDELEPDERAYAILNTHFKSDYKKLNPVYRTRQLTTIVSAMRRELYSDLGVENTMKGFEEEPLMLSAKEKRDVDNLLSEYARREVRNQLVYMKAPGWATKKPLPTEPTIELLRTTQPMVAEEFERRVKKAKVYSAETVQEYWPEVRDRLLQDRDEAFLKDIQSIAKAMR